MIDVKAARRSADTPPSPTQVIARSEDDKPLSKRCLGLLLAIFAAVVAFVQSLSGKVEAAPLQDKSPETQDPEEAVAAPVVETFPSRVVESEDEISAFGEWKDERIHLGQSSSAIPSIAEFMGSDSPAFEFEQGPLPVTTSMRPLAAADVAAANDNGAAAGRSSTPPSSGDPSNPADGTSAASAPERNRAPQVATGLRLADIGPSNASLLTALMLLAGASDADGDTLAPRNLTVSHGTLTQTPEGWLFQPQANYFGLITLSYEITDGTAFVAQSATFNVVEFLPLIGTPGNDALIGTASNDLIEGLAGDDVIEGRDGKDKIFGGAGNDVIYGGAGDDIVYGGAGNDIIRGGTGNDGLHGEDGDDKIYGEAGDDWLTGGAGNDHLDGGDGNDRLDGGAGNDELNGGEGNDEIDGGSGRNTILTGSGVNSVTAGDDGNIVIGGDSVDTISLGSGDDAVRAGGGDDVVKVGDGRNIVFGEDGNDRLVGGAGEDTLAGGAGSDTVYGGHGDDTVIVDADEAVDAYAGGAGQDTLDLSALKNGTLVDLVRGEIESAEASNDKIESFEVVIGGTGDDTFIIGNTATTATGGSGKDKFKFELDGHDAEEDAGELIHKILDLEVGDRIIVSQYTIRKDGDDDDSPDDQNEFTRHYSDDDNDADRPFRFRIEKVGEDESTFIDMRIEYEGQQDVSIEISGAHRFYYYG